MEIYHGSNIVIETPQVKATGFYKDFGFGFYCTRLEKQAQRWAVTKRSGHVVNVYEYKENKSLDKLSFETMTEEWLDFIAGNITREAFWVLTKFKYPTHQIVFCTEKALKTLSFKRSYAL